MGTIKQTKLYRNIHAIITQAKANVATVIQNEMLLAYWETGRMIIEEEQGGKERAVYGTRLIAKLSKQLSADFGAGFGASNLRNMRRFYRVFPIRDALRHELSWTHYRMLMRVQNETARAFYIKEALEEQWGTRTLERQINTFYYERLLSSQNKKAVVEEARENALIIRPEDVLKDPYVLEFLQLKENQAFLEKELEAALIDKLQEFLLELGKGFSFVARQKRISVEGDHYYIDLVFYNYRLKCFVLLDLKVGKLTHQDIGQLDFYVRYWEDNFKPEGDNPTIGIILCSEKNETIVRYSTLADSRQLYAAKYMLYLPTEEELSKQLEIEMAHLRLQRARDEEE